jgi:hypothetical protein
LLTAIFCDLSFVCFIQKSPIPDHAIIESAGVGRLKEQDDEERDRLEQALEEGLRETFLASDAVS